MFTLKTGASSVATLVAGTLERSGAAAALTTTSTAVTSLPGAGAAHATQNEASTKGRAFKTSY